MKRTHGHLAVCIREADPECVLQLWSSAEWNTKANAANSMRWLAHVVHTSSKHHFCLSSQDILQQEIVDSIFTPNQLQFITFYILAMDDQQRLNFKRCIKILLQENVSAVNFNISFMLITKTLVQWINENRRSSKLVTIWISLIIITTHQFGDADLFFTVWDILNKNRLGQECG